MSTWGGLPVTPGTSTGLELAVLDSAASLTRAGLRQGGSGWPGPTSRLRSFDRSRFDHATVKSVDSVTSMVSAVRAFAVSRSRRAYSRSSGKAGSPKTYGTAFPCTIRGTPTDAGMVGIAVHRATGIPRRSISFAIVAPQRLQVPQVAVRMAACTWASNSS